MKIFHTMNIVVVDIVCGVEFDADFIYANGFSHRALLDGQNEHILIHYCLLHSVKMVICKVSIYVKLFRL